MLMIYTEILGEKRDLRELFQIQLFKPLASTTVKWKKWKP